MDTALRQVRKTWQPNPWGLVWTTVDTRNGREKVIPVRPEQDRARWHDLQVRAGVTHPTGRAYHVHEMRHTTATILLELGVAAAVVEAILGHSALVKAYQHVRSNVTRQALVAVADVLKLEDPPGSRVPSRVSPSLELHAAGIATVSRARREHDGQVEGAPLAR